MVKSIQKKHQKKPFTVTVKISAFSSCLGWLAKVGFAILPSFMMLLQPFQKSDKQSELWCQRFGLLMLQKSGEKTSWVDSLSCYEGGFLDIQTMVGNGISETINQDFSFLFNHWRFVRSVLEFLLLDWGPCELLSSTAAAIFDAHLPAEGRSEEKHNFQWCKSCLV